MRTSLFIVHTTAIIYLFCGCSNKIKLNKVVQKYKSCTDTTLSFYSGKEWEGLRLVNRFEYYWGENKDLKVRGPVTYYYKKHIGKGSIIKLNDAKWIVSKFIYKRHIEIKPPFKTGKAYPTPEYHNVRLILKQMCTNK